MSDVSVFFFIIEVLWLSKYDWGFSINKRLFINREYIDKIGFYLMVYYCKINNGIFIIMDIIINGIILNENILENVCMLLWFFIGIKR